MGGSQIHNKWEKEGKTDKQIMEKAREGGRERHREREQRVKERERERWR